MLLRGWPAHVSRLPSVPEYISGASGLLLTQMTFRPLYGATLDSSPPHRPDSAIMPTANVPTINNFKLRIIINPVPSQ